MKNLWLQLPDTLNFIAHAFANPFPASLFPFPLFPFIWGDDCLMDPWIRRTYPNFSFIQYKKIVLGDFFSLGVLPLRQETNARIL